MNIINIPSGLQNLREKNVNFGNFQNNCQVNSKFMYLFSHTHTRFLCCLMHFSSYLAKLQTLNVLNKENIV